MLSSHPYNLWPLHVKFFTHEANKVWNQELGDLPTGLTCVTELEGVDGKSGLVGSGRVGPVDVTDGMLTLPCPFAFHPLLILIRRRHDISNIGETHFITNTSLLHHLQRPLHRIRTGKPSPLPNSTRSLTPSASSPPYPHLSAQTPPAPPPSTSSASPPDSSQKAHHPPRSYREEAHVLLAGRIPYGETWLRLAIDDMLGRG